MSFGEEDQLPRKTRNTRKGAFFVFVIRRLPFYCHCDIVQSHLLETGALALRVRHRYLWGLPVVAIYQPARGLLAEAISAGDSHLKGDCHLAIVRSSVFAVGGECQAGVPSATSLSLGHRPESLTGGVLCRGNLPAGVEDCRVAREQVRLLAHRPLFHPG